MTHTCLTRTPARRLILIDIENLAGTPSPTCAEVDSALAALRVVIPGFDQDQKIVACSHHAARNVAFRLPQARHLWRSGRDGADLAILDVLENERVDERFERVSLCSGDGIFAPVVARLASVGVEVTAVSVPDRLAARLRLAARYVALLPHDPLIGTGSAS